MADITVRVLDTGDWQVYRQVRLAALEDEPGAFAARFDDEASYGEDFWRKRMDRAHRIVAERGNGPVGVICLGLHNEDVESGEVFGLWTAPAARGHGVGRALMSAAVAQAIEDGRRVLYFWAGSDNGPAIGFASGFGFRPTTERRPARVADGAIDKNADEVALLLSLRADPTQASHPSLR